MKQDIRILIKDETLQLLLGYQNRVRPEDTLSVIIEDLLLGRLTDIGFKPEVL